MLKWWDTYKSERTDKPLAESSIKKDCVVVNVAEGFLDINMLIYSGPIRGRKEPQKGVAKMEIILLHRSLCRSSTR